MGDTRSRTLEEAISAFLAMRRSKKQDPATVAAYATTLHQAHEMLTAMRVTKVFSIDENHVNTLFFDPAKGWPGRQVAKRDDPFVTAGRTEPLSTGTLNNHIRRFKTFMKWCHRNGYIRVDPSHDITEIDHVPCKKIYLGYDQLRAVIEAAEHPRDRILLALVIYTCRRVGEITSLTLDDIDLDREEIEVVLHKTKERITLPMYDNLMVELRRWLSFYESKVGKLEKNFLLVPRVERPELRGRGIVRREPEDRDLLPLMEFKAVNLMLTTLFYRLDKSTQGALATDADFLNRQQKFHVFRRSGARLMYDRLIAEGEHDALRQVQSFLHHKTQAMTERYIGIDADKAKLNRRVKGKDFFPTRAPSDNVIDFRRRDSA